MEVGWIVAAVILGVPFPLYVLRGVADSGKVTDLLGHRALEQGLMSRGIDPSTIPKAAQDEIVALCLKSAPALAAMKAGMANEKGMLNTDYTAGQMRLTFISLVDAHASEVKWIMLRDQHKETVSGSIYDILVRHGVVRR